MISTNPEKASNCKPFKRTSIFDMMKENTVIISNFDESERERENRTNRLQIIKTIHDTVKVTKGKIRTNEPIFSCNRIILSISYSENNLIIMIGFSIETTQTLKYIIRHTNTLEEYIQAQL